jgi:GNAT superfamily N-acetyltransferase
VKIRQAISTDYADWLAMVNDYNDEIIDRAYSTWTDFFSPNPQAICLIVTIADKPVAFLQYTMHYMCFQRGDICYISDLYVLPEVRRRGIARALLKHMVTLRDSNQWWRLYWITEFDNPVRPLYDEYGIPEFVRYHNDRHSK